MSKITALIIVDMQDWFLGEMMMTTGHYNKAKEKEKQALIEAVILQVYKAKIRNIPIVCLEYADLYHGFDTNKEAAHIIKTHPLIKKAIADYKKIWYVSKDEDDGSYHTLRCLRKHKIISDARMTGRAHHNFRVCGVNLDACVRRTIMGLIEHGHEVELVKNATRNTYDGNTLYEKNVRNTFYYHNKNINVVAA